MQRQTKSQIMVNYNFEIVILQHLKTALNYTIDNLISLDTLRVRNIIIVLKQAIDETIKELANKRNEDRNKK